LLSRPVFLVALLPGNEVYMFFLDFDFAYVLYLVSNQDSVLKAGIAVAKSGVANPEAVLPVQFEGVNRLRFERLHIKTKIARNPFPNVGQKLLSVLVQNVQPGIENRDRRVRSFNLKRQ